MSAARDKHPTLHQLFRSRAEDAKIHDVLKELKQIVSTTQFNQLAMQQDESESTPLHLAVSAGLARSAAILIPETQAEKDCLLTTIRDRNDETVLHLALQRQNKVIFDFKLIMNSISNEALFELYIKDRDKLERCAQNGGNGDEFKALIADRLGALLLVHYLVKRGGGRDNTDFENRKNHYRDLKLYLKKPAGKSVPTAERKEFKVTATRKFFFGNIPTQGYYEAFNLFMRNKPSHQKLIEAECYFEAKAKMGFVGLSNKAKLKLGFGRLFPEVEVKAVQSPTSRVSFLQLT